MGLLAAACLAGAAVAQPPPPPSSLPAPLRSGPTEERGPRPQALFISPAGEPFRGVYVDDGLRLWFDQADDDHDGALTLPEFVADHLRFFHLVDRKGDGQIDGVDVTRYERETAPEIIKPGYPPEARRAPELGRDGKPKGVPYLRRTRKTPEREGAARFSVLNEPQPLRYADTDMDFRVTETEWTSAANRRFTGLDANGDGRLVPKELALPPTPFIPRERRAEDCPWWYCDFYYMPYVYNPYPW